MGRSMRFTPEFLNEIRARVPVSQVVGSRVKLRKEGREWRGLSPFNAERTPSFFVNDHKQFYHDFSSGKHGNVFTFLVEAENLSLPGGGRAAGADGGARPAQARRRDARRATTSGRRLNEVLALAAEIFARWLNEPLGARARGYLADRGLDAGDAARLRTRLRGAGKIRAARRARRQGRRRLADDRRGAADPRRGHRRALRPVPEPRDVPDPRPRRQGRGVRRPRARPGAKAKYLNSPETELFHKGSLLFNHHRARKPAGEKGA